MFNADSISFFSKQFSDVMFTMTLYQNYIDIVSWNVNKPSERFSIQWGFQPSISDAEKLFEEAQDPNHELTATILDKLTEEEEEVDDDELWP